jgi:pSer/pThr/pTyr-binding forkhead associated (FHA) protein
MTKTTDTALWLLKIRSSQFGLKEYTLNPGENKLGRQTDNDIVLLDQAASGHHAVIEYDQTANRAMVRDLKSTNGTFINGKRISQPFSLHHDDQIRIGHTLISVIDQNHQIVQKHTVPLVKTKVTGELILQSIDQYGILLHEVGKKLINMPVLDHALTEISDLIKRMIGAEECHVVLSSHYDDLVRLGVPAPIIEQTIETQSTSTFSSATEARFETSKMSSAFPYSNLLVPVIVEEKVVALILVRKSKAAKTLFSNSDLQLVLAVGNQVAISIQRNQVEAELIHKSSHAGLCPIQVE